MIGNYVPTCAAVLVSLLMQSCIKEGITGCENYIGSLDIDYHWDLAPDASPDGMTCFFFREDDNTAWRFDFPDACGGEVRLPLGDYAFITVNDDAQVIFDNDDSYDLFTISTRACELFAPVSSGAEHNIGLPAGIDETVVKCPGMLWCDHTPYVGLGFDMLSYQIQLSGDACVKSSKFKLLPVHPECIVRRYHVDVSGVSGLGGVRRVSVAMSGMSGSVRISDLSLSPEGATLPFAVSRYGSDGLHGEFFSFGRAADPDVRNILYLFVWLSDGSCYSFECDVTSQIVEAADQMDVWIHIQGIEIPESSGTTGSFDVSVDQWNKVTINFDDL